MRFAISLVLLAAVLSAPSAACGVPQLAQNVQVPKTFVYEEGWTIPGLAEASVDETHQDEDGSTVIHYKPSQSAFVTLQGFELSSDGKSLQFVPGYVQLVTDIFEYRVQGRIYAYTVRTASTGRAHPPMWQEIRRKTPQKTRGKGKGKAMFGGVLGCGWTNLRYFDADGDGRFESLEYLGFGGPSTNSTFCPTTPEWVLKLLPNRAAAERCAKDAARAAAAPGTSTWPPAVKALVDYTPPKPVLAPKD